MIGPQNEPEEFELDDADDPADLGRAIADADLEGPPASGSAAPPLEAGPRRWVLTALVALVFVGLVWMLFQAVPDEDPQGSEPQANAAGEAARAASQSDPQWMQNQEGPRPVQGAPGQRVLPGRFNPDGAGNPTYGDTALAAGGTQPQARPAGDPAPQGAGEPPAQQADPRREAFAKVLGSKPLGQAAGFSPQTDSPEASGVAAGPAAPQQGYSEAAAEAEAEAERRSAGVGIEADRAGAAPGVSPGYPDAATPRASRSSYVVGGGVPAARAQAGDVLVPRGGPIAPGTATVTALTLIRGQLHTAINTDLPGPVIGEVTHDVYDGTGRILVIPRLSRLLGTYESDVATGQTRTVLHWTAVRLPSGVTYDLPALKAGDPAGASGLRGRVNNHYRAVFGQALLTSVIAAGFEVARGRPQQDGDRTRRDVVADAASQQLGQVAADVTRRNLNIKPTHTHGRLTPFTIVLDRDLTFVLPSTR